MTDDPLYPFCVGVMVVQLAAPLILGVPSWFSSSMREKLPRGQQQRGARTPKGTHGDDRPPSAHLVPLTCMRCSAPVPLEAESFPCPHCGAEVRPPPEYVAALRDRKETQRQLDKATRVWRWSRWTSSRPVLWLASLLIVAWTVAVLFAALGLSDSWPKGVLWLAGIVALLFALVGFAFVSAAADERKNLPPPPQHHDLKVAAEAAICTSCGAPITFAEKHLATICPYCSGENYRAALANASRQQATAERRGATRSLRAAVRDVRKRREELFAFVGFLAVAETFYAVFFGLSALWDAITG